AGTATTTEKAILRLLTPVAKLYTARQAIASASEVLEAFGGAGYVEDTGLPRLLGRVQGLSSWEGTTNVLSLDTLRAIEKEEALEPFLADLRGRLDAIREASLAAAVGRVRTAVRRIEAYWQDGITARNDYLQGSARAFAYGLARSYAAGLLLEHADWSSRVEGDGRGCAVARRWCAQELAPLPEAAEGRPGGSRARAADEECSAPTP